jgi:4'-phosphopantetheinyl transferase EntD
MLELILPSEVRCAETDGDCAEATLHPSEEALVAAAVPSRRREFATGRQCARRALFLLGLPPGAIGRGPHGDPLWPDGVVGSITHCDGYRAAAVASANEVKAIGIDAEPSLALPAGLLTSIAVPSEVDQVQVLTEARGGTPWDRLLFSAKEAAYKAWYALHQETCGFREVVVNLNPYRRRFVAQVRTSSLQGSSELMGENCFGGRWTIASSLILTAVVARTR